MLRDYQEKAVAAVLEAFTKVVSTAVVMPTGTGKTVVISEIIKRLGCRAIVLAHRDELVWQAQNTIKTFAGIESSIEMGEHVVHETLFGSRVIVSTVQTHNSKRGDIARMRKFNPKDFGLLVIDECHHSTANTYRNVVNYYQQNPDLRVVGFTATPDRADEEALGQVYQTVAYDYEILDAIQDGWLVPLDQICVHIHGLDYSHIRKTAGDLNVGELAKVMEVEERAQGVAGAALEIIGERRAIVFTVSVAQAETTANIFNRHRPGMAAWVCGTTNKDDRRQTLDDFKLGKIQVVCNCGVLTEGFDDPGVEVIVMARPTLSRSLYAQMCGRSLRPLPGIVDGIADPEDRKTVIAQSHKPAALIVDLVGNSGKHKLVTVADILGGKVSDRAMDKARALAKKLGQQGKAANIIELLDEAERLTQKEIKERKAAEEAKKAALVAKVKYGTRLVNPFNLFQITPQVQRDWERGKQLTPKERQLLMRQGIDPDTLNYTHGKQLIAEFLRRWRNKLCTPKQAKVLQKFGFDTRNTTFAQASKIIDSLAKNNWQLPAGHPDQEPILR